MSNPDSPILKPPSRARSRPSTPGASFLHTASLNDPSTYPSNTAEIVKTLTPNALTSSPPSPTKSRKLGEPEPTSRSKTSLTLSLPEEETFGQPSIDLPGLNIGFGLGAGSRTSRIEECSPVVVVEEVKRDSRERFEDVDSDVHDQRVEDRENKVGVKGNEPEAMMERRIAEMLDDQREDEEEDENNGIRGVLKKIWGNIAGRCCCF